MQWSAYERARADLGFQQVWCHDHGCDWEKRTKGKNLPMNMQKKEEGGNTRHKTIGENCYEWALCGKIEFICGYGLCCGFS
jgi:hypothetical protein